MQAVRLNRDAMLEAQEIQKAYAAREIDYAKAMFDEGVKERDEAKKEAALRALQRITLDEVSDDDSLPPGVIDHLANEQNLLTPEIYDSYRKKAAERRQVNEARRALRRNLEPMAVAALGRAPSDDEREALAHMVDVGGADEKGVGEFLKSLRSNQEQAISRASAAALAQQHGVQYVEGEELPAVEKKIRLQQSRAGLELAAERIRQSDDHFDASALRGDVKGMRAAINAIEKELSDAHEKFTLDSDLEMEAQAAGTKAYDAAIKAGKQPREAEEASAKAYDAARGDSVIGQIEERLERQKAMLKARLARLRAMPPEQLARLGFDPADLVDPDEFDEGGIFGSDR